MKIINIFSICFITLLFVTPILCKDKHKNTKPLKNKIFNIKISDHTSRLLTEVEQLYGSAIIEKSKIFGKGKHGFSYIDEMGFPTIEIDSNNGLHEYVIAHELYHLKLYTEGFPAIQYHAPLDKIKVDGEVFNSITNLIYDPIQHYFIFPKIRKMNLNPNEDLAIFFKSIKGSDFTSLFPTELDRAVFFYRANLELEDPKLINEITSFYKKNNWGNSIDKGNYLVGFVKQKNPSDPETMVSAFIECVNYLYQDVAKFEFEEWKYNKLKLFNQRIAIIRVHYK